MFHAAAAKHAAHGVAQCYQEGRQEWQDPHHLQGGARRQTFAHVLVFDWQCPVLRLFLPSCSRIAKCLTLMLQVDLVEMAQASPDTPLQH